MRGPGWPPSCFGSLDCAPCRSLQASREDRSRWSKRAGPTASAARNCAPEPQSIFWTPLCGAGQEQPTIVAIGPLTNIAALLEKDPAIAKKNQPDCLDGGLNPSRYGDDPTPVAEYNIAADPAAAQKVFSSGIHILMVPLDVTAMLQLRAADRHRVFTNLTPMTDALAILYNLWHQRTPTLFDPMAVAIVIDPSLCQTKPLNVEVDSNGFTRVVDNKPPNATVALQTDPQKFFQFYLSRVAPEPKQ